MSRKNATGPDRARRRLNRGKKTTIMFGSWLGMYYNLMLNKPEGKESWEKKLKKLLSLKQVLS